MNRKPRVRKIIRFAIPVTGIVHVADVSIDAHRAILPIPLLIRPGEKLVATFCAGAGPSSAATLTVEHFEAKKNG
jgi:hypothetical protein